MSDEDQPYDNEAAQKIDRLVSEAVNGRDDAVSYVNNHDVIEALRYATGKLNDTGKFRVLIDYDAETTDTGTVVGFTVSPEPMIWVRYKTTHGRASEALPHVSASKLVGAVKCVDSAAFETAAINEVEAATEDSIRAGELIE